MFNIIYYERYIFKWQNKAIFIVKNILVFYLKKFKCFQPCNIVMQFVDNFTHHNLT